MSEEFVDVSSSSEPEIEELLERDIELEQQFQQIVGLVMGKSREGVKKSRELVRQSSIDEYLERPDGHEREKERRLSGGHASASGAGSSVDPSRFPPTVAVGKWKLDEGVFVEEPGRSMTSKEIKKFRKDWIIPSTVLLRPVEEEELASRPPPGWVAVHENMFRHGFTLPLPGWVQYILSALRLAPAQIGTNAWRQLLGMYTLWQLSGQGWPTHNEVFACYKAMYSTKKGCSGTVTLHARAFGAIVEDLPTSAANWRSTVCFAGGEWDNSGFEPPGRVPTTFQPIGRNLTCFSVRMLLVVVMVD